MLIGIRIIFYFHALCRAEDAYSVAGETYNLLKSTQLIFCRGKDPFSRHYLFCGCSR